MATLIKQHGRYALQFYDAQRTPQRKRIALLTGDKRTATGKQRELEHDYLKGLFDPWVHDPYAYKTEQAPIEPRAIGEAVSDFLDAKRQQGRAENTLRTYYHILGLFARTVGTDNPMRNVTGDDLYRFICNPDVAPSTQ